MSKAKGSIFNPLLKASITMKFAIMMGGFMLILLSTIGATFWTSTLQEGDTRVINVAGRQRMLSQKMTKEAMALLRGNAKKSDILSTAKQFDNSLNDLISGNPEENIPPTKEADIKAQLNTVKTMWVKFYKNLTQLLDIADKRAAAYSAISETNLTLLKDMNDAVFMMEQEALDARTINLAGRQRMLSQKMAKEALLLESGEAEATDFQATVSLFDETLNGLIGGSKALGLRSMKSSAVLAQLRKVEERWNIFRGNAENLIALAEPSAKYVNYILNNNVPLLKEMNKAVLQYEKSATAKVTYLKVIQLILLAITMLFFGIGWFFVTNPIVRSFNSITEDLSHKSEDIEGVTREIHDGVETQTSIVQTATKDLEYMILNIIQGSITMSVEKQTEIARAFGEFLKHFVERTSAEIAMGMMSVSQQSSEARQGVEKFVSELTSVEGNIKSQEAAIEEMVEALKSIVSANEEIKIKAHSSTAAADKATSRAFAGQEKIGLISEQLQEIGKASEGIRDVTNSLATITESIKILALNMSLKVEDIKDDTGKSYGFEAMSAKVQQLAEEVEGLLARSREMIIPTIEGIAKVSGDANQANEMIAEVTSAIKAADDESRAITEKIEKQASGIDRVELEAENLRILAHKTTETVEAQASLAKDVDIMLKDASELIDSVNKQTSDSVEGARKVNDMMDQLSETVISIEGGTGDLTEKSTEISDMFNSIMDLANKNKGGAERLGIVNSSVRDVSRRLSDIVKGA